jgi:hypothetical protein
MCIETRNHSCSQAYYPLIDQINLFLKLNYSILMLDTMGHMGGGCSSTDVAYSYQTRDPTTNPCLQISLIYHSYIHVAVMGWISLLFDYDYGLLCLLYLELGLTARVTGRQKMFT